MTTARKRIVSVTVAFAVVAACVLGYLLWRRGGVPSGFIVTLRPIDANSAIAIWRRNEQEGPARGFVGRLDADGTLRWWRELPAVSQSVGPSGYTALGHGMIAILYAHQRDFRAIDQAVIAYSVEGGERVWDTVLTPFRPREQSAFGQPFNGMYVSSAFIDARFVQLADNGAQLSAYVLDPATGARSVESAGNTQLVRSDAPRDALGSA